MRTPPLTPTPVSVETDDALLEGLLTIPDRSRGIIIFAHGSGSSRFSSRNGFVARTLNQGGLSTLLFDLLTAEEGAIDQETGHLRFDIPLLARRLTGAVDWVGRQDAIARQPIGLFGSSTGAAAALITASVRPDTIRAVVSRGGRPDLAGKSLAQVAAPSLFIVGGNDHEVLDLNFATAHRMNVEPTIIVVSEATHLFPEPGKLEQVAHLARDWFLEHLAEEALHAVHSAT